MTFEIWYFELMSFLLIAFLNHVSEKLLFDIPTKDSSCILASLF